MFHQNAGRHLYTLAEDHFEHDLRQSDRDALKQAAGTITTHATVGSLLGLGLGVFFAYRFRRARIARFDAFKARGKPTTLKYADGKEEGLPGVTSPSQPDGLTDLAIYAFLGAGGLFFGSEIGLLTGTSRARSVLLQDRPSYDRILGAFRAVQAQALRQEADAIDRGERGVTL